MSDTCLAIVSALTLGKTMLHLQIALTATALALLSLLLQSLGVTLQALAPRGFSETGQALNLIVWTFVLWSAMAWSWSIVSDHRIALVGAAAFLVPPAVLIAYLLGLKELGLGLATMGAIHVLAQTGRSQWCC